MKMLLSGMLAAALLTPFIVPTSAQETKQPSYTYTVPDEHKEFVEQFKMLLKKFPKAEKRFKLADVGDSPVAVIIWKCKDWPDGFVDCSPEVLR